MKEIKFTYQPYSLQLKEPFVTSTGPISERRGFLIKLKTDSGTEGIGDCSPFPEFGSESLSSAEEKLKDFKLNLSLNLDDPDRSLYNNLAGLDNYPALHHGFEQAIINLICAEKKISLNEFFNRQSLNTISVNGIAGLLPPDKLEAKIKELVDEGYLTIKAKVGRNTFSDDLKSIKIIRDTAGNSIKLRLDANGRWNKTEAVKNLSMLEQFNIEYVEQPVENIEDFSFVKENSNINIAADESVRSISEAVFIIKQKLADVLILKPMMLGGIVPVMQIADLADEYGVQAIITSSFESNVGRAMAIFAASVIPGNYAHGLGTSSLFTNNIYPDPYPVTRGKIFLK